MKVIMTIPVKNHDYLIRQNILYHYHKLKVDGFVIYLHNSTDHTKEILEELSQHIPIIMKKVSSPVFRDSDFRTEMAFLARDYFDATWVITNDIDEFICTKNYNIHSILKKPEKSIVYYPRYNVIPYMLYPNTYTSAPESYHYAVISPKKLDRNLPFYKISPIDYLVKPNAGKAICRVKGLSRIDHGAHEIIHSDEGSTITNNIYALHYLFTTKKVFLNETGEKVTSILSATSFNDRQNWHVKFLKYLIENNKLADFAEGIFLNDKTYENLLKQGIIEKIPDVENYFNPK